MCFVNKSTPAPIRMAAQDNREASRQADIEAALRRRRAGAAANVLTSASGIPASVGPTTAKMGGVAA